MSKLCVLPWMHISATTDGKFRPCCLSADEYKSDDRTISSAWHSDDANNLRSAFVNSQQPPGCKQCWDIEESGGVSKRINDNRRFGYQGGVPELSEFPQYIDLKLGSVCNLKCRICTPENSTRWVTDAEKLNFDNNLLNHYTATSQWPEETPKFWQDLYSHFPNVSFIDFAGGDPLLIRSHNSFMRKINGVFDLSGITLHYNTNGTIVPPADIIGIWQKFKRVELMISIDGIGDKFEYMRHGATWDKVIKNIQFFLDTPGIEVQICHTISVFNVCDLPEFITWSEINSIPVYINMLHNPEHYCIKSLSTQAKSVITAKLNQFLNTHCFVDPSIKQSVESVVNFLNIDIPGSELIAFTDITGKLDQIRNENFPDTFPEISKFYNDSKHT